MQGSWADSWLVHEERKGSRCDCNGVRKRNEGKLEGGLPLSSNKFRFIQSDLGCIVMLFSFKKKKIISGALF